MGVPNVVFDDHKVHVNWGNGQTSHLEIISSESCSEGLLILTIWLLGLWKNRLTSHNIWLRDHCQSEAHFHPLTKQRLQNTFEIPEDVHASNAKLVPESGPPTQLKVTWAHDKFESTYELDWLKLHSYDPVLVDKRSDELEKKLWAPETIDCMFPEVDYQDVMDSENGVAQWTKKIHELGFCLVKNVPVDAKATEKLIERISYIRPTHYGGFWDFTADLAMHDTAYTNLYLASHTDGTYWSDTPGLQLFHILHHDGQGGETMLTDGFAAAKELKQTDIKAYEFLSKIKIPAHSAGEESVCITPSMPQPIFTHHSVTGELVQVRWNNDDRSTMDQWDSPEDVDMFYKSIRLWKKILLKNEIVYKLVPGTCLIFDNWRVLHGRQSFNGSRRMCGAYINRDDFVSRMRILNLGRSAILKGL